MKVSSLELQVDEAGRGNHGLRVADASHQTPERQRRPPSTADFSFNNHPPFNYFAVGGIDYNINYVENRTKSVPTKIQSGEDMLQRPPKVTDDLAALYSWSSPSKNNPSGGGGGGGRLLRPRTEATSSSTSLPNLASPDRATTASSNNIYQRGPAEAGNARHLVNGYNLKGAGGTWRTVAKNEWEVDRPAMRADADGLAYGFTLAMAVVDGERRVTEPAQGPQSARQSKGRGGGGGGGNGAGGGRTKDDALKSSLENDFLAIKAQVGHSVDERQALVDVVDKIAQVHNYGTSAGDGMDTQVLTADVGLALGLSPGSLSEIKDAMARCVYEQKWTDLTFNQLCSQVSVSCRQHGDLLLVLRSRYANLCNKISKMYSDSLWQMDTAASALLDTKKELREANAEWARRQQSLEEEVMRLKSEMEMQEVQQVEKRELIQQESRDQVKKMGETLRTLNGIFRNMQTDVEAMRAADLKDQIETLRSELHEKKAELLELRPVVEAIHVTEESLHQCQLELETSRQEQAQLKEDLRQREALIQELMIQKSDLITEKDKLLAEMAKAEGKTQQPKEETEASSRKTLVPSSVLCARCNQSLDAAIRVDEMPEYKNKQQCYAYRLMIPNNAGKIPARSVKWTRQCMRAIIYAKVVEMAALGSTQHHTMTRFPEFLYAWFEPTKAKMDGLPREERAALLDQANENRWGLYYGVKALARENAEARLFWSLLDETYGADYQAFYLYAFNLIENVAGASLRAQWGQSLCKGADHDTLERLVKEEDESAGPPLDPALVSTIQLRKQAERCSGGQETIWVELAHVKTATDIILSKAPRDVAVKVWEAIKSLAVTSEGRMPPVPDRIGDEECVELYLWLRLLMQNFRQDQINRRAAIKLMFTTSLSGVMTNDLDYDPARPRVRTRDEDDRNPHLNLPQTLAVVRTLWPLMSTTESVAFYREVFEASGGHVDFENFMKVAERLQFFSRSLVLPSMVLAKVDRRLDHRDHVELDALVHLHFTAMTPYYSKLKDMLPDRARSRFEGAEHELLKLLDMRRKAGSSSSDVDGLCPLFAYRRLLLLAHHFRAIKYEEETDFTGLLTPVKFGGGKLLSVVRQELSLMEQALLDDREDQVFVLYQDLRRKMAACRIQASWRRKIKEATLSGVPASVMCFMRRGYAMGRGGLKSRRQNISAPHVQSIVGEIFRTKMEMDRHLAKMGLPLPPFSKAVYLFFLKNYGCRAVAERCMHDFFHNARKLTSTVLRVRLFGLFVGLIESDKDIRQLSVLQTDEAVDFYLRGLMLIRTQQLSSDHHPQQQQQHHHHEGTGDDASTAGGSGGSQHSVSSTRVVLFPVSHTDNKGRKIWEMPTSVLIAVSTTLFKPIMGGNTSTADFLDFIEDVKALENRKQVDVDEFMWAVMKLWSHIVYTRSHKARAIIMSSTNPVKHVLSSSHFRKLEDEVTGGCPESLSSPQQDLLTLLSFYNSNDVLDRFPKKDAVAVILESLKKRLFVDMWEPVVDRCKLDLARSKSFEFNQLSHDWNSYEMPLRAYVNAITSRRSSNVYLPVANTTLTLQSGRRRSSANGVNAGAVGEHQLSAVQRRQSRVIEAAAEAGRRSSAVDSLSGGAGQGPNMVAVLQVQDLLLRLEHELKKLEAPPAPGTNPGGGVASLAEDLDDLTVDNSAMATTTSTTLSSPSQDPWTLLREALATMNDLLVTSAEYDIRTEFIQDVEPSALGKLSFVPR